MANNNYYDIKIKFQIASYYIEKSENILKQPRYDDK